MRLGHYLKSAHLLGNPQDPWGKSARFYAAEVLADGEFLADAIRVFQSLLDETKDGSRRSVLRNRIQQLQLRLSNVAADDVQ